MATASNNTKENKKENGKYNTIKRSDNDNEDLSLSNKPSPLSKLRNFKSLGPGIITGGSDDDPSGIATCSQAGAQFGFVIEICPSCMEGKVESMPLSINEICEFQFDEKRGVTLEFKTKK